jgi:hypothetical protein
MLYKSYDRKGSAEKKKTLAVSLKALDTASRKITLAFDFELS